LTISIARLHRAAAGHVLRRRDNPDDVAGDVQRGDGVHRSKHRCPAAHVGLHHLHAKRRLDGDATGVERDPLSHKRQRAAGGCPRGAVMANDDHNWWFVTAARDAEQRACARSLQGGTVHHLDAQRGAGAELAHLRREVGRRQRVGRHAHPALDAQSRLGEHHRLRKRGVEGGASASVGPADDELLDERCCVGIPLVNPCLVVGDKNACHHGPDQSRDVRRSLPRKRRLGGEHGPDETAAAELSPCQGVRVVQPEGVESRPISEPEHDDAARGDARR
jgi:hypothetical protein